MLRMKITKIKVCVGDRLTYRKKIFQTKKIGGVCVCVLFINICGIQPFEMTYRSWVT